MHFSHILVAIFLSGAGIVAGLTLGDEKRQCGVTTPAASSRNQRRAAPASAAASWTTAPFAPSNRRSAIHRGHILVAVFLSGAGIVAGLTLLETIGDEKRQCGVTAARCIVTQPQTCCSGQCCCELDDDCNLCTLPQEEGRSPGTEKWVDRLEEAKRMSIGPWQIQSYSDRRTGGVGSALDINEH
ncbi:hypothetical protein B0H13DRAFT_1870196 [Mycena leptocephala]|nr:hypothetical protein B0H13DRAFT_1870196 [Mycena leptocephala]